MESWKNPTQVAAWLRAQGWEAPDRTVRRHAVEGKLGRSKEGVYTQKAALAYAAANLNTIQGAPALSEEQSGKLAARKLQAEAKKLEAEAERQALRLQRELGQLLPRAQVEEQEAAAAQLLKSSFEAWAHDAADALVEICEGRKDKIPELLRYLLDSTEDFFDQFSSDREWTVELMDLET